MVYMDLYNSITNPIDDDNLLDLVINAYTKTGAFYNGLTSNNISDKECGVYNPIERDNYYVYLFNLWKNHVLHINENDMAKTESKEDVRILANYLSSINPTTYEEVIDIIKCKATDNTDINNAIRILCWNRVGRSSSWDHVDSSAISLGLHSRSPIEHRLYVNIDSSKVHLFLENLLRKSFERRVPVYYKFDSFGERDDSIVLYCDTNNLPIFINLFEEIKDECSLDEYLHNPPILTGVVNGWIGYGSEPGYFRGDLISFNEKREMHLKECIKKVGASWITNSLDKTFKTGNREVYYFDYFLESSVNEIKDYMDNYGFDNDYYLRVYGCTKEDFNSKKFDIVVLNGLKNHINEVFDYINGKESILDIKIPYENGVIRVTNFMFDKIIKKQIEFFNSNTKEFKESLRREIKETSKDYEIDSNNYSFDIKALDLFISREEEPRVDTSTKDISLEEKPKVKRKRYIFEPLSDEEIKQSREKLGYV